MQGLTLNIFDSALWNSVKEKVTVRRPNPNNMASGYDILAEYECHIEIRLEDTEFEEGTQTQFNEYLVDMELISGIDIETSDQLVRHKFLSTNNPTDTDILGAIEGILTVTAMDDKLNVRTLFCKDLLNRLNT